jgi:hypothetical protein
VRRFRPWVRELLGLMALLVAMVTLGLVVLLLGLG